MFLCWGCTGVVKAATPPISNRPYHLRFVGIPTKNSALPKRARGRRASHIEIARFSNMRLACRRFALWSPSAESRRYLPQGETNEKNSAFGDCNFAVDVWSIHRFSGRRRFADTYLFKMRMIEPVH
jgi:hypothetical protein